MTAANLDQPVALASIVIEAMAQVDACPDCPNTEPPRAFIPLTVGYRCSYLCSDCRRAWTTDYEQDD